MRIDFGPGYRVYCMREGTIAYLLICGRDKSTQKADIIRAQKLATQVREAANVALQEAGDGPSKLPSNTTGGTEFKLKAKRKKG